MDRISARDRWTVVALLALAALLRLPNLGRDALFLDEAVTWWNATRTMWIDAALAEINHGPVWWLVTRAVIGLAGDSEAALRFPAAVAGILAVPGTFVLARALAPARADAWRAGALAGLLAAFGGYWIEYAQEARMYSTLLLLAIAASLLALRWWRARNVAVLALYGALAALALYVHVLALGVFLAHAAHGAIGVLRREKGALGGAVGLLAAQAFAVLAYVPWAMRAASEPTGLVSSGRFGALPRLGSALWRMAVGPAIEPFDAIRIAEGMRPFLESAAPLLAFTALVSIVAIALGVRALLRDGGEARFAIAGAVAPIALLLATYGRVGLLHEKYLAAATPFLAILAAFGAVSAPRRMRVPLVAALVGLAAAGAVAYHGRDVPAIARLVQHGHAPGKEDWRAVRAWVASEAPGDLTVVLVPSYLDRPWDYYDRGAHAVVTLERVPYGADSLAARVPALAAGRPVRFVFSHLDSTERARLLDAIAGVTGRSGESVRRDVRLFPLQFGIRVFASDRGAGSAPGGGR